MMPVAFGDIDGAPNGSVYVSVLANDGEHFVVQVRSGTARALARSSQQVPPQAGANPQFVLCEDGGAVYTGFYFPTGSPNATHRGYVLFPSSITTSGVMEAIQLSSRVSGGGYDRSGYLMLADGSTRELVIASVASERVIDRLLLPAIDGMTQPAPTDAAIAPDGTVYVTVRDLFDTANQHGAVLRYPRAPIR
jgi:hypothetical protein